MEALRLFLHVLAASVWVGGQIVLAGLLPTVRSLGEEAPAKIAAAFNRLAWPAYGLLWFTGIWNLMSHPLEDLRHPWIEIKVLLAVVSAAGAALHIVGRRSKAALAAGGALAVIGALGAMYAGFLVV